MYRITADDDRALISSDAIYQQYARNDIDSLHEKNLFHLGEDRMLTTLLLKIFSDMSLSFVPIAACWTIVPDEFRILLSQRRRWINSTFHNMWELLKVNTMCGFCCISMNSIVLIDLFFTLVLPSGIIYGVAYIYTSIVDGGEVSSITLVLYAVLIGSQVLIFLVRSRFDYILWFAIYMLLGIPVFYFILPIYSFWHMDDFSWGTTRQVAGKKKSQRNLKAAPPPPSTNKKPKPDAGEERPSAAAAPAVATRRTDTRRERRPSLGEDHRSKLAAMGAGQMNNSRSWEDGYPTTSSHGSSSSGSGNKKKSNKGRGRSYMDNKYSTAHEETRPTTGPVDLDDVSDIEMQSPIAAAKRAGSDPPAFSPFNEGSVFDTDFASLSKDDFDEDDDNRIVI